MDNKVVHFPLLHGHTSDIPGDEKGTVFYVTTSIVCLGGGTVVYLFVLPTGTHYIPQDAPG